MGRSLLVDSQSNSCYFRTGPNENGRKALVQITERCNLHCAHCFVSSTKQGIDMSFTDYETKVLPRLIDAKVQQITLTGGEPFAHPDLIEIATATSLRGIPVGICTNGTNVATDRLDALRALGSVHINVSFDGFRAESHGRFRGAPDSFHETVDTTREIAARGLLQGILSTPNAFTDEKDYVELTRFAIEIGATYILMNPLSPFGRGAKSKGKLAASRDQMRKLELVVRAEADDSLEVVPIRFPNTAALPLAPCEAGDIVYVFTDGELVACPYLAFAARAPASQYSADAFTVGNVLHEDIAGQLSRFDLRSEHPLDDPSCTSCVLTKSCGKGCPAAVVAAGELLNNRDKEICVF